MMNIERQAVIREYLQLADDTHYHFKTDDAMLKQYDFMSKHRITRQEIDDYKKQNVRKFDSVQDAMASMFG